MRFSVAVIQGWEGLAFFFPFTYIFLPQFQLWDHTLWWEGRVSEISLKRMRVLVSPAGRENSGMLAEKIPKDYALRTNQVWKQIRQKSSVSGTRFRILAAPQNHLASP